MTTILSNLTIEAEYECSQHYVFITAEGIVLVKSKKARVNIAGIKEVLSVIDKYDFNVLHLLVDPSEEQGLSRDARNLLSNYFDQRDTVIAVIMTKALTRMIFQFVMKINKPQFVLNPFFNHQEAYEWLFKMRVEQLNKAT